MFYGKLCLVLLTAELRGSLRTELDRPDVIRHIDLPPWTSQVLVDANNLIGCRIRPSDFTGVEPL